MNAFDHIDCNRVEQLRELARQGATVADMIRFLRTSLGSTESRTIKILRYFRIAFNLTLREARNVEGAHCMGNAALSDEELDLILLPVILERLPRL